MKQKFILLISGCFMAVMTSCLGSSSEYYYEGTKNAQLLTFSLTNDSIDGLDSLKFTIDQLANEVHNLDSMPVGTVMEKALCKLTYGSAVTSVRVYQEASGDTIDYSESDSIDFSKPVKILLSDYSGSVRKYDAWVNIHTQVPDSLPWNLYSSNVLPYTMTDVNVITNEFSGNTDKYIMYTLPQGKHAYEMYTAEMSAPKSWSQQVLSGLPASGLKLDQMTSFNGSLYVPASDGSLYVSTDAANWTLMEGTPKIKAVMGALNENVNQPTALSAVVDDNGVIKFGRMEKDGVWSYGAEMPDDFPLSGFAKDSHEVMFRDRLLIAGGRTSKNTLVNSAWSTTDALTWAMLTDIKSSYFSKREGASLAYYDDKYYLVGGIDEAGKALKDIYHSIDNGVTWAYVDTLVVLPKNYTARGFASMIVDNDNALNIIGGKQSATGSEINEHWRGRVNRLGFLRK